ncbi:hypothetical protein ACPOL_0212 [Acidisarcina polymorpha]|uniref:Uncharacterized protein n=1 Tax=Acidisarcina polymorpha TaxID=2211140 RepID=A0A2Z5FSZ2_9BACT|nr:hypothetical protein ACPOL_0212 [Acidisarcina polymorpha]
MLRSTEIRRLRSPLAFWPEDVLPAWAAIRPFCESGMNFFWSANFGVCERVELKNC